MDIGFNTAQSIAVEIVIAAIGLLLARKCHSLIKEGMNYFWRFIVVLNVYLLINIPVRLFELKIVEFSADVIYWFYAASIVLTSFVMYYWFLFMLKELGSSLVDSVKKVHLSLWPAFLTFPMVIINKWTGGWLFYIEGGEYHRGVLFVLQGLIAYVYLLFNIIYLIKCLFSRKTRKLAQIGLYAMGPAVAGVILQNIFAGSFLLSGITICASIMYIDICLDKQKTSEMKEMKEMFVQTAETLASAIDVKDEYTHGHSIRVAQYSRKIAEIAGLPEEEAEKVYFSGLLHDVGKIGIPDWIINKQDRLTQEEFSVIKEHPTKGRDILAHIRKLPYLTMGAKYHHERYDGLGYPDGLKATDIPEIPRIIAVADAYDAMTSSRSYREPLPQKVVREEILKGAGRQFDPEFARIMVQLIDNDVHYKMKQNDNSNELYCREARRNFYKGIEVNSCELKLQFQYEKLEDGKYNIPTLVLFDAIDHRVHIEDQEKFFYLNTDYCDIRVDGEYVNYSARKLEVHVNEKKARTSHDDGKITVEVTAVKQKDHVVLHIDDGFTEVSATVVLPDSSRFSHIGITGKQCYITDIAVERSKEVFPEEKIVRIAEEIKYFDKPDGDIPNVQVDSWRTVSTPGIPVKDELKISFFAKSLPFARLIWHCPFIILFDSDNGLVDGNNFREFAFIRCDGESWQRDSFSKNKLTVTRTKEYKDWYSWKAGNKEGREIEITVKREGNQIFMKTDCGGLVLNNVTTVSNGFNNVYLSLTGDQVILESIKIHY